MNTVSYFRLNQQGKEDVIKNLKSQLSFTKSGDLPPSDIPFDNCVVHVPNPMRIIGLNGDEDFMEVTLGREGVVNSVGVTYNSKLISSIQKRLSEGAMYGEYGAPVLDKLEGAERMTRVETVDIRRASHEVLGCDVVGDRYVIYVIPTGLFKEVLQQTMAPSFGMRATATTSLQGDAVVKTLKDIVTFDLVTSNTTPILTNTQKTKFDKVI